MSSKAGGIGLHRASPGRRGRRAGLLSGDADPPPRNQGGSSCAHRGWREAPAPMADPPAMSSGSLGGASPAESGTYGKHRPLMNSTGSFGRSGTGSPASAASRSMTPRSASAVKRDLLPTRVYLHRGTMSGAGALGIDRSCPVISVSELPEPFADLKPHEIEDCLCMFKGLLSGRKTPPAQGLPVQWSGLCAPDPQDEALALLSLRGGRSPPARRSPAAGM